ncbi:MAG: VOC family protein [Magnetococcales bacterium]|nr:VOC family protein [Magnetococcales bacterium]
MHLDAVGIISRDISQSRAFYALFGLTFQAIGGTDHWEATTPSGVRIMLDSVALMKKLHPEWVEPTGCGMTLCFKQESPEQVDALFARITDAGFKEITRPWDAFWGQRYATVHDPDGNQIDLFATLPEGSE